MNNKRENLSSLLSLISLILVSLVMLSILFYTPRFVGFMTYGAYINTPPIFNNSEPLPNVTFEEDTTRENAINLNKSFFDPDGDEFIFKVFGNSSVIVTINQTTKNVTFSTAPNFNGIEQMYFVGDDSHNRNATSNTITVNVTPITDIFWAYQGTNFSLLNLSLPINFSIFNNFGNINFTSNVIDFSANATKKQDVNLTKHVNISFNRIEVNSTHLPELNESAILTINGLSFNNPRPLRDGEICPDSICTVISYSGGALKFNVTSFTIYSSEETPSITARIIGGAGGGRRIEAPKPSIEIDKEEIKIRLRAGETKEEYIKIKNNLEKEIKVELDLSKIEKFLAPLPSGDFRERVKEIILQPGQQYTESLSFFASEEIVPDVYIENIIIKTEATEQVIPVIIEAISKDIIFDLSLKVLERYKEIPLGENVFAELTIFYLKEEVPTTNILVNLIVKDFSEKIISQKEKTISISSSQTSLIEEIPLPPEISLGKYIVIAKTTYDNKTAVASDTFKVVERITFTQSVIVMAILTFIIILVVILLLLKRRAYLERGQRRELEIIHELIMEAQQYLKLKDEHEAIRLYHIIREKYNKLPRELKSRVWQEAKSLEEEIALHIKQEVKK